MNRREFIKASVVSISAGVLPESANREDTLILHYKDLWSGEREPPAVYDYGPCANDGVVVDNPHPAESGLYLGGGYINTGLAAEYIFRDSFTICLWIKPDEGRPYMMQLIAGVVSRDRHNGFELQLKPSGRIQFVFEANNNVDPAISKPLFISGPQDWHFVAITAKNNGGQDGFKLYFDRAMVATGDSNWDFNQFDNSYNLFFGRRNTASVPTHPFYGRVDDIRIYAEEKTEREIREIYGETQ